MTLFKMLNNLKNFIKWKRAFKRLPSPKTEHDLILDEEIIRRRLIEGPVPSCEYSIDGDKFARWVSDADYENNYPAYYPENRIEKTLEHYVAAGMLNLQPRQVYLDVAAESGVAARVYEKLYGVSSLMQDLSFAPGVYGSTIGCDASQIPLPDESVDAMALHCSFEHFEGDSDMGFIREAGRLLRPGGRCVIAPLYLCQFYACLTDPLFPGVEKVSFPQGAMIVALKGWRNRHGRFYDQQTLEKRIWNQRGSLDMTVYRVENFRSPADSCYLRFFALLQKP